MKLKKIKLINWHIFTNNIIELDGNTLITGENASGKSTLMDAIYFVLSGGDQNHFNKAANESGQRNLETYMRGKKLVL
ncbi:MAG: AAA family ATPase [Clostridium sp.]|nr:MAG: AAA family ATPase [Clostridium sp.]